jgi:cytoskeleton protein RodZ
VNTGEQDNGQGAGQIGPILEKKRLEKGLSLKDVEQATKIRTRYLQGLEREDPTVLPDPRVPEDVRELPRPRRRTT